MRSRTNGEKVRVTNALASAYASDLSVKWDDAHRAGLY
jgi:hypothetical protein